MPGSRTSPTSANATYKLWLRVQQSDGSFLKGSGSGARATWIPLSDVSYSAERALTGAGPGSLVHKPLEATIPSGPHTPQVVQALVTSSVLPKVVIEGEEQDSQGAANVTLRVTLQTCRVSAYDLGTADATGGSSGPVGEDVVSFTYQQVTFEWPSANLSYSETVPATPS